MTLQGSSQSVYKSINTAHWHVFSIFMDCEVLQKNFNKLEFIHVLPLRSHVPHIGHIHDTHVVFLIKLKNCGKKIIIIK